jgi:hypothetical protein
VTNKFARRFVMTTPVIIRNRHRYLQCPLGREASDKTSKGRTTMRKTVLTLLGSALLATATVQIADAAQQQRKAHRAPAATTNEQFRNSNAAWPQQQGQSGYWSRYSGGYSAPAGR